MHIQTWNITGGGFHFGQHGLGQEETTLTMPSDSLFAALVARLVAFRGSATAEKFATLFTEQAAPFVLSSTFPRAGNVRFFPTPARTLQAKETTVRLKDLKKVAYVSEALFRDLLEGHSLAQAYPTAIKLQNGEVLISQSEAQALPSQIRSGDMPIWSVEQRPRVTLGRAVQTSSIYFTGSVTYAPDCGLWFGIRWFTEDPVLQKLVAELMADLGDAGLGAERSTGLGGCKIIPGNALVLPDPAGKHWVSLSRYIPRKEEMSALSDPAASYSISEVSGWLDSPSKRGQRRRVIHLVNEGAVLGPLDQKIPGRVVDVRPSYPKDPDPLQHAVYRSGLALAVGMQGCDA